MTNEIVGEIIAVVGGKRPSLLFNPEVWGDHGAKGHDGMDESGLPV
jgi:hypothetical protein